MILPTIENLDVYYGRAHALQDVSLDARPWRPRRGRPQRHGQDHALQRDHGPGARDGQRAARWARRSSGLPPNVITGKGIGYVPQGRRVWPSLSVDEHLRLAARSRKGPWTVERIYQMFPRLAERKAQRRRRALGRRAADARDRARAALQPAAAGHGRAHRGAGAGDRAAGRGDAEVARRRRRDLGAADRAEPRRRHRRRRHRRRDGERPHRALDARRRARRRPRAAAAPARREDRGRRATDRGRRGSSPSRVRGGADVHACQRDSVVAELPAAATERAVRGYTRWVTRWDIDRPRSRRWPEHPAGDGARAGSPRRRVPGGGQTSERAAYIAGTFDTKGRELFFLRNCLEKLGVRDGDRGPRHVGQAVAGDGPSARSGAHHPQGERAVFTGDRGSRGDRDGARLRAFRGAPARPRRPHLRRRLGRHRARHAARCAACPSACPR